ncbi:MAG TPA: tagaturonate reductase [Armatimonadota bacterium]
MKPLSRALLASESYGVAIGPLQQMPERIMQFGEGNFLRAFVDWMVNAMNRQGLFQGKVVVVQPLPEGLVPQLNAQDGLYTLLLRGMQQGQVVEETEVITSVSRGIDPYADFSGFLQCAGNIDLRVIISNTTEAGITFVDEPFPIAACPASFPAKITVFLYARYVHFAGAAGTGMILLPCELIDRNGDNLRRCVLQYIDAWGLEPGFRAWVEKSNFFLNTLVDRIVTGYPREEVTQLGEQLGYDDALLDTGEIFHLWVIEGDARFAEELPFTQAGLNVLWTDNMEPYRTRKVRILNGAHTMTVLAAYLYGKDTVRECVEDPCIGAFMRAGIFDEIIPTLDLPEAEKAQFAEDVLERFRNPFIRHLLLSISLNSVSKWKVRVLPSLCEYVTRRGTLPPALTFSLAALLAFYRGTEMVDGVLQGSRDGQPYPVKDEPEVLEVFAALWRDYAAHGDLAALCRNALAHADFWGQDLTTVPGLTDAVTADLTQIVHDGMAAALQAIAGKVEA